jgi:hypothetical protein
MLVVGGDEEVEEIPPSPSPVPLIHTAMPLLWQ